MIRKTLIKFEDTTFQKIRTEISRNGNLTRLDNDLYEFTFDDFRFTHALWELDKYPQLFGHDLGDYLNSLRYELRGLYPCQFLVLDAGDADFKRRASENFGVCLSSLFMVTSFDIEWQKITQIPLNKGFTGRTPDFRALSRTGEKFIYEAKGTTQIRNVSGLVEKGLKQAKLFGESSRLKFAFVSFIPTDRKDIPPCILAADPVPDVYLELSEEDFLLLHYKSVFEHLQLKETSPRFLEMLRKKLKVDLLEKSLPRYDAEQEKYAKIKSKLKQTYESELKSLERIERGNLEFVGRWISVPTGGLKVRLFFGVENKIAQRIIDGITDMRGLEEELVLDEDRKTSILSDGTILQESITRQ